MKTHDTIDQIAERAWTRIQAEAHTREEANARVIRPTLSRHDCEALAVAFRAALFDQAFPEKQKAA
jgi:hypothetical protein